MEKRKECPRGRSSSSSTEPSKPKTETVEKRETRSRHEKKRREEMNQVLTEMMELLPEDVQKNAFKIRRIDQKPKRPDKCFIIGNTVDFIRKSTNNKNFMSDELVRDAFELSNCFLVTLNNFVISGIDGYYRSIFDMEKNRMLGKDIRCFLDFESGSKLSFLTPIGSQPVLNLRSFMAKPMTCRPKINDNNPSEMTLICVPDCLRLQPQPVPSPLLKPPSKIEIDRPILAALLRRKDPPKVEEKTSEVQSTVQMNRHVTINTVQTTPMHSDTASTSSCSFLSPCSSSSASIHPTILPVPVPKPPPKKQTSKRKRLRSVNVIVESYSLDDVEHRPKILKTCESSLFAGPSATSSTLTSLLPAAIPAPLTIPTTSFLHPITSAGMAVNPYDVLAPGYKDIWLRLQSERLLLEERIVAKEGELKNLMLAARSLPQYIPPLNIAQYTLPQSTLDLTTAQNP